MPDMPDMNFYEFDVPALIYRESLDVYQTDICVFPEGLLGYVRALRGQPFRRIMFCQNHYYLPFTQEPARGFAEFGLDGVVASSLTIQACLKDLYGIDDIPVIPCAVDPRVYPPAPSKLRQIAFMPRKLGGDVPFIQAVFVRMYPNYADVPWVAIDGVTRKEAARMLSESAVFLSLASKESFGLPPLEAMAAGCVVAGFHGEGGREYMNEGNGWWAETGDWRACVRALAAAIDTFDQGAEQLHAYRRRAMHTVQAYSVESMQRALLTYWKAELAGLEAQSQTLHAS